MIPYRIKYYLNFVWEEISLIISIIIVFVMSILLIYSYYSFQETTGSLTKLNDEIRQIKLRTERLKKSQSLVKSDLKEINKLLAILIPDIEDFFSIIQALETISYQTGFTIMKYSVNIGISTDRISMMIDGSGNIDSFMNFLKSYSFSGGRFITSEKIEFTNVRSFSSKIQLNFYNKQVAIDNQIIPELTENDIDFFKRIKNKININLKESKLEVDTDYPTKTNPF